MFLYYELVIYSGSILITLIPSYNFRFVLEERKKPFERLVSRGKLHVCSSCR